MANSVFEHDLIELYQGEIIGEVIFDRMLGLFDDPVVKYKIAAMLQLETETKARLRPVLMQLGLDIAESKDSRDIGLQIASGMQGKDWLEAVSTIRDIVTPAVGRYKEIAANAPDEFQKLAQDMVAHEQSLFDFAELELSASKTDSLAAIIGLLQHWTPERVS